jgi:hypothetical protein
VLLGSGGVVELSAKAELVAGSGVGIGVNWSAEHPASSAMTNPTGQNRAMAPRVEADPRSRRLTDQLGLNGSREPHGETSLADQ